MGYDSTGLVCDQPTLATAAALLFQDNKLFNGRGPLIGLQHNSIALFGDANSAWRDIYMAVSASGELDPDEVSRIRTRQHASSLGTAATVVPWAASSP